MATKSQANLLRILAIDDTPANLMTLGAVLANEFDLQIATSGAQGLAQAEARRPDLILLDIMMPEMDGYEVCRRLKAHPDLHKVPVIFITALGDVDAETAGLELGAADYLTKPINVELARLRIRNHLERESLRREVEIHRDHLETKVAERTQALSIAKEAAEAANRAKTAFLATMGHELRTPLNHIMGMNTLATRLANDPRQLTHLTTIKHAAERLLGIVNNVLDVAQLEARRLPLEAVDFRPADIFAALQKSASQEAAARHLALHFAIDPALESLTVQGDRTRLQQIIHTLIENAFKFTPTGQIDVRARLVSSDPSQARLLIEVEDSGIGISAEDQKRIFAAFVQQDGSSTRQYSGTGLGLALCKALLECMQGQVKVRSELHKGSCFSVDLSLPRVGNAALMQETTENALETLQTEYAGAQLVLLEADTYLRDVLTFTLEDAGLQTILASPATLEAQLLENPCQWLLLNPDLPEIDAPALIHRLRHNPATASLPILLLSEQSYSETIQQAMAAGAQGHLTQPIEANTLYALLCRHTRG